MGAVSSVCPSGSPVRMIWKHPRAVRGLTRNVRLTELRRRRSRDHLPSAAMSAQILDGAAVARSVRERVAEGVRELVAGGGPQPGLATVLVGADPASQIYVRRKNEQTAEAGMQSFHHELAGDHPAGRARRADRQPQRRSGRARDPRAEPAAGRARRGARVRAHRSRQGRRRLPSRERGAARAQPARACARARPRA